MLTIILNSIFFYQDSPRDFQVEKCLSQFRLNKDRLENIRVFSREYVDSKKIPCQVICIMKNGKLVFADKYGYQDVEEKKEVEFDTIFRIYSMSKPIISVALMILYERGKFQLNDLVSKYIPAFKNQFIYSENNIFKPVVNQMTIKHLLTHTSGLSYGFDQNGIDQHYRTNQCSCYNMQDYDSLEQFINKLGEQPLLFNPGQNWHYSMSVDVCGRLIEILSGVSLEDFLKKELFEPLNMKDTGFNIEQAKLNRFASCYQYDNGGYVLQDGYKNSQFQKNKIHSGGGGLISTAKDYLIFLQMILNKGFYNDKQYLSSKTIEFICQNHLHLSLKDLILPYGIYNETNSVGMGFGLGFALVMNNAQTGVLRANNEISWGGLASTGFWIDFENNLCCIHLTQLIPSSSYNIRDQLRTLIYSSFY